MLQKSVHLYEYMDVWEIFSETSLPKKKEIYSNLILESITDIH